MSTADEIAKLAALREAGDITVAEFDAAKASLLGTVSVSTPAVDFVATPATTSAADQPHHRRLGWIVAGITAVLVLAAIGVVLGVGVLGKTTGEAMRKACLSDAGVVDTAVSAYDGSNGVELGTESGITLGNPSTYSQGAIAQTLLSGGWVSAWPTSANGYSISMSTTDAGQVLVHIPPNNPVGVLYSGPGTTACNAL